MGIIGHWTFDNVTGSIVHDDIGSNNGTLTNVSINASGKFDDCVYDYVADDTVARHIQLDSPISFKSISMWVRKVPPTNIWLTPPSTDAHSVFAYSNSALLSIPHPNNDPYLSINFNTSDLLVSDNDWHHIVVSEGSDNNHHWLYVDGVKASSELLSNFNGTIDGFGCSVENTVYGLGGLDNIQVYDNVLSDAAVNALFLATDQAPLSGDLETVGELVLSGSVSTSFATRYITDINGTIVLSGRTSAIAKRGAIDGLLVLSGSIQAATIKQYGIAGNLILTGGVELLNPVAMSCAGSLVLSGALSVEHIKPNTINGMIVLNGFADMITPGTGVIVGKLVLDGNVRMSAAERAACRLPEYSTQRWS